MMPGGRPVARANFQSPTESGEPIAVSIPQTVTHADMLVLFATLLQAYQQIQAQKAPPIVVARGKLPPIPGNGR